MKRPSLTLMYPAFSVAIILGAWEACTRLANVPAYLLPPMSAVVKGAVTNADILLPEVWITGQEIVLGFLLSVVVGVPLGVAIFTFRPFEKAVFPLLISSQVIPKIAISPLLLVWFGYGMTSKVMIAFLIAFFPIVIDTVGGLRALRTEIIYLASSMGAPRWRVFVSIRLPGALPTMFVGFKLAATFAVTGAIVGEFAGADRGIGRLILTAGGFASENTLVFSGVLYVIAMGLIAFGSISLAERLVVPWHRKTLTHL